MGMTQLSNKTFSLHCKIRLFTKLREICVQAWQDPKQIGCMGTKAGMTTWHMQTGDVVPCTVVALEKGNVISQVKRRNKDGYDAIQVAYKKCKEKRMTLPELGHLRKAGCQSFRHLTEFKGSIDEGLQEGKKLVPTEIFKEGTIVDVTGFSIGKGFQGGIKRWNMHRGFMTHGSKSHRAPGSIGMRYSGGGGRVMPGLKMPGRLGNERVTVRKLRILSIDMELNAIVIKGSLPGKPGSILSMTPSVL